MPLACKSCDVCVLDKLRLVVVKDWSSRLVRVSIFEINVNHWLECSIQNFGRTGRNIPSVHRQVVITITPRFITLLVKSYR